MSAVFTPKSHLPSLGPKSILLYLSQLHAIFPRPIVLTSHTKCPRPHLLAPPPSLFDYQSSQFPSLDTTGIQTFGIFGDGKTAAGVVTVDYGLAMTFGEEGLVLVPELGGGIVNEGVRVG